MAEKLSIQIALQGGAEVERQLAEIGEAGQQAFAQIEQSAAQVGGFKNLKPEAVTAKLKTMGVEGTAAFGKIQQAVATASRFEKMVVGLQAVEAGFVAAGRAALAFSAAAGGVGVLIAAGLALAAKASMNLASEITKINAAAMNLGLTIEQFDRLRLAMEKAGLAPKAITSGLETFKASLDKIEVERVTQAFNQLQEAATRGYGAQGTAQLQMLEQAAKGVGPAADVAREALVKLGLVPPELDKVSTAMQRLGITSTNINTALPEILSKLQQIGPGAQQSALAIEQFGTVAGPAIVQALNTTGIAIDQNVQKQQVLSQETANSAAKVEQSYNQASAAAQRFGQTQVAPSLLSFWDQLITKVNEYAAALLKIGTPAAPSGSGNIPGKAGGGLLGGRGSGTSDSNLAWLSRGEYIMPARAVARPGVLSFLEALRRSGRIPGFAVGGLVGGGGTESVTLEVKDIAQAIEKNTEAINSQSTVIMELGRIIGGLMQTVGDLAKTVSGLAQQQSQLVQSFNDLMQFAKKNAPSGKARGGLLGGRGTGTSDSNLAWVLAW